MSLRCRGASAGRLSWTRSARWRRSTSTSPRSLQRCARHDVTSGIADTSVTAVRCMRRYTAHRPAARLAPLSGFVQDGEQQAMPSNLRKSRLPPLSLVPVITREVEVDPGGRYEGLPHFSHFGDQIKFVGGVNRPKLIQACCSTEGRKTRDGCMTLCAKDAYARLSKVLGVKRLYETQLEQQNVCATCGRSLTATVGGTGSW